MVIGTDGSNLHDPKSLLVLLAFIACAYADVSHLGYDYHAPPAPAPVVAPKKTYIPPVAVNMYLPPAPVRAPKNTYIPPKAMPAPITKPSNDYLPPVTPMKMYLPPVPVLPPKPVQIPSAPRKAYLPPAPVAPKQSPNHSYLPPVEESAPAKHIITPPAPRLEDLVPPQRPQQHYEDSEIFTEDGYKTKFFIVALVLVAGVCADVSELGYDYQQPAPAAPVQSFAPAPEQSYIPPAASAPAPVHHAAPAPAPVHHHPAPAPVHHHPAPAPVHHHPTPAPVHHHPAPAPVHHHPAPAPVQHHPAPAPVFHQPAPVAPAPADDGYSYSQPQADQGYRYKTVRRVVYRNRA
ncbi:uncharacterized protein LOC135954156 [Calliphora vicina]|uniref:uncharacterized protein LOC135954156 n=1 Tax=Calliphora vicina TaxID=7373 RepID=UPI00325C0AC4